METVELSNNHLESKESLIPQIRFDLADKNREAELFNSFIKRNNWLALFANYKELITSLENEKDENKRKSICLDFVEKSRAVHEVEMQSFSEDLADEWNKLGTTFLKLLSEHFQIDWPGETSITGHVSILPVFPRFLDEYSFFVGYKNISSMIEVCAHEILHFLWFKKWKEVFPDIARKEYERPSLVWRLSEIMDPIILQSHPGISELIKPKGWGYKSFKTKKIGDVGMTEYFKKIYLDSIDLGDTFDITLKKLLEEAKLHEAEIGDL